MKKGKRGNSRKMNKTKGKLLNKKRSNKASTRRKIRQNKKMKKTNKSKLTLKIKNIKKKNKVMKGGAIPFYELNPSAVMEQATYQVKGLLSNSALVDSAQPVPNNLSHNVNPSVLSQPHLDGGAKHLTGVAGESPDTHFASSS